MILHDYRVVFQHTRNGVKFEVIVPAPTQFLATRAGGEQLAKHMQRTAGHVSDWAHYSTAEVSVPSPTFGGQPISWATARRISKDGP